MSRASQRSPSRLTRRAPRLGPRKPAKHHQVLTREPRRRNRTQSEGGHPAPHANVRELSRIGACTYIYFSAYTSSIPLKGRLIWTPTSNPSLSVSVSDRSSALSRGLYLQQEAARPRSGTRSDDDKDLPTADFGSDRQRPVFFLLTRRVLTKPMKPP